MKKISIIIATYNAGKVLQRCLDSIRPQKAEEIELLIIDGKSKDNTVEIIQKNSDIIDYYVSEPDRGIYDAWNKGIKASIGEWVQFLGADDELLPNAVHTYLDFLQKKECRNFDIISGKSYLVDENNNVLGTFGKKMLWKELRHNMLISHGSTLHNRNFINVNGNFSLQYKICADYEFFVRYGSKLKGTFINEFFLKFRVGGASDSISAIIETFMIRYRCGSVSVIENCFYALKGFMGFYYRKLIK